MIRWPLLPFSFFYWIITSIRNLFYNWRIFKSKSFSIPIICVGNLSVGGTGKSPHSIYIVDLLKDIKKTAVLSRGYGRLTSGYRIANYESNFKQIGDEAMQMFLRFKNKIVVAVSEDRVSAVNTMLKEFSPELIVLDDAFQHRKIKAGLNILLTEYGNLFSNDFILPAGNLRESAQGAKRAHIIIVTKAPENITEEKKKATIEELKLKQNIPVFFSHIIYDDQIISKNYRMDWQELIEYSVLLVTGIANDAKIAKYVQSSVKNFDHISFKDHHHFTDQDVKEIQTKYEKLQGEKIILTTEKDYTRLLPYNGLLNNLFYLPINIDIDDKEKFNSIILNYATKHSRHS